MTEPIPAEKPAPAKQNPLLELFFTILLPAILLSKLSSPERLGPALGLIVALAFPIGYGIFDLIKNKKFNLFAILGIVNVSLTGGLGLLEAKAIWIAIKESVFPLVIGLVFLVSLKFKKPLVERMLMSDMVLNTDVVEAAIAEPEKKAAFRKLMVTTTWFMVGSFVLSAILNFFLAIYLLKSPAGTEAFNKELSRMMVLSFPIIALPLMIITMAMLFWFLRKLNGITGLPMEAMMKQPPEKKPKNV